MNRHTSVPSALRTIRLIEEAEPDVLHEYGITSYGTGSIDNSDPTKKVITTLRWMPRSGLSSEPKCSAWNRLLQDISDDELQQVQWDSAIGKILRTRWAWLYDDAVFGDFEESYMNDQFDRIVRAYLQATGTLSEAAPDATDALDDAAGGGLDDELPNEDGAPLPSHDSKFDALKSLAKRDLPTLRHLAALKKVHDSQANLTGKDASLAIQAILNRLDQINPAAAAQLGQKNWEPNALSWIELFDTIGDQKLGKYIGIKDHASIPTGSAIEAGTDDEPVAPANDDGEEGTAAPESDDGTGDTDEVEALLKKPAPTPSPAVKESIDRLLETTTKFSKGDKVVILRDLRSEGLNKGETGVIKSVDYVGGDGDPAEYTAAFGAVVYCFDDNNRWVGKDKPTATRESHTRTIKMVTEASKDRYAVRFITGDELWQGAEPGWYWGNVTADGSLGDTNGPFESKSEATRDLQLTRKPSSATRESHTRTIKRITETGDDGYNNIDDIVASHGDRKVVAFIHNRHQERVPFTASLEDALHTFEQYSGDVADIISDWKTVESYGDLAQYVRGQQPERGSEED